MAEGHLILVSKITKRISKNCYTMLKSRVYKLYCHCFMFVICKEFKLLTIEELLIVFIMFKLSTHKQYYNNVLAKGNLFAHKKEHIP